MVSQVKQFVEVPLVKVKKCFLKRIFNSKIPPEQVLQVVSQDLQTLSEVSAYCLVNGHDVTQVFVEVTPQYAVGVLGVNI